MLRIGNGSIPERHHRIAHELVDGAALLEDDVGQRREQPVDEADQRFCIHALREPREAAHVGEQQSHFACLAAKLELRRIARQLVDHRRRHVVAEGAADAGAVGLGLDVGEQRSGEVDGDERERGIDGIEQISGFPEQEPRRATDDQDRRKGRDGGYDWARPADEGRNEEPDRDQEQEFGPSRQRRSDEMLARNHLLERLGVDLDARNRRLERRRAQVEKARRAGPDQDVAPGDLLGIERSVDDFVRGDISARIGLSEIEP